MPNSFLFIGRCLSLVFLSACATQPGVHKSPVSADAVKFSRYFSVTTCYQDQKECIGPVVKDLEVANVEKRWQRFGKAQVRGLTVFESYGLLEDGIPFKGEIRITKKENSDSYHVYMMLRSGPKLSRKGIVKTFKVKDLSSFKEVTITDEPIAFDRGRLKAQLSFGPALTITN